MSNFRITTNGVLRNYRTNLSQSYKNLNDAMERVETHRQFNSYAEDPARATRSFQTRAQLWRASDQVSTNKQVTSQFSVAFSAFDIVVDGDNADYPGLDGIEEKLRLLNDPTGSGRQALGQELIANTESLLKIMNTTYGDVFVFAGSDGLNVPFSWGENGEVLYRGIPVDTPNPEYIDSFTEEAAAQEKAQAGTVEQSNIEDDDGNIIGLRSVSYSTDDDGNTVKTTTETYYKLNDDGKAVDETGTVVDFGDENHAEPAVDSTETLAPETILSPENAFAEKYGMTYADAQVNYAALEKMAGETVYVDLGLGMKENANGDIIDTSAYNSVLCGLNFIGYGLDEDGDPLNFISLMRQMGEIGARCDTDTGDWASAADEEQANVLVDKLKTALGKASEAHVDLTAEVAYLNSNLTLLETTQDELQTQRSDLEDIDPADAITDMLWAQYCYNAALRIGNDVLSQSLLDYMS